VPSGVKTALILISLIDQGDWKEVRPKGIEKAEGFET